MKQLIPNGRYWIPLSAYEYIAMPVSPPQQGIVWALVPPKDTTYSSAPHLVVMEDGSIHSNEGRLDYTIDDLNYGGRIYDWDTHTVKQQHTPPKPEST